VAQECKILRETDPYTKETKISSGFINLQGGVLSIDADIKEIDFFFEVTGKCFNDASTIFIFLEGSKIKTTYRNTGSVNCDGYFHFKFKNGTTTPTVLQKMATQKTVQFIFTGSDKKETIVSLLPEDQKIVMEATACIVAEAKTLIKK
jgi:hypothetical protein